MWAPWFFGDSEAPRGMFELTLQGLRGLPNGMEASARFEPFLSFFFLFFFSFSPQNLQDEHQKPAPGDSASRECTADLCATEPQGKIQQFEDTNQVFICKQQIQCLMSLW